MGGELLTDSSPSDEGQELKTYTETFYEHFPFYLSIGMTYEQYWEDDADLVIYYRKAYQLSKERKNQELWLQGLYVYEAICDVSPILHAFAKKNTKPRPYPKEPYALTKQETERRKENDEKERYERIKRNMQAQGKKLKAKLAEKGE